MNRLFDVFKRSGLLLALVLFLPWTAQAQVARDWTFNGPGLYGDMIAMDKGNNVYVVGSVPWSTVLIRKFSPTGTPLWQRSFDNPGTREQGSWITIDPSGNAIVTGYIVNGADIAPNGLIVLKYDPSGNLLWQDVIPVSFGYTVRANTDTLGNVYVLGRSWTANASGSTTLDIVTLKYSPAGVRQWTRYFGFDNTSADAPASMAITPAGNVIVVGGAVGRMLMVAYDPAGNKIWSKNVVAATGATDVAVGADGQFVVVGGNWSTATGAVFQVIKHDASFNELWRKTYPVGHYARRAAIDSKGNAIVTGVTGNYLDWMTIKLDPNGNLQWQRRYNQHRFNDEVPYFMVLGPDDAAYITGQGGPGPTTGEMSYLRTVTLKYAADGTQVWAATSFESVRGLGVALGSDNSVAVIGESPLTVFHYSQAGSVNQPPVASAAATTATTGPAPLQVSFSAAGSTDPDGTIVGYQWDFGDGTSSLLANPVHVYAVGNWTASLTVTDNAGGSATSVPIAIKSEAGAPPPATPTAMSFSTDTIRGGRDVQATVTVSSAAGVVLTLSSSDASVASVPASVRIPVGSTNATFTVRTSRVRTSTVVTIGASANNASQSARLTVTAR